MGALRTPQQPEGELALAQAVIYLALAPSRTRAMWPIRRRAILPGARWPDAAGAYPERADLADEGSGAMARATNTTTMPRTDSRARTTSGRHEAPGLFYLPVERGYERDLKSALNGSPACAKSGSQRAKT